MLAYLLEPDTYDQELKENFENWLIYNMPNDPFTNVEDEISYNQWLDMVEKQQQECY